MYSIVRERIEQCIVSPMLEGNTAAPLFRAHAPTICLRGMDLFFPSFPLELQGFGMESLRLLESGLGCDSLAYEKVATGT